MLQVKQIVNNLFTSNTYIVFDDEYNYCWLVDIGDYEKVANELPNRTSVKGVFLTHTHFDHVFGINALHKDFPDCCIYTAKYGKEALYDEKKNFSKYHESPFVYEGTEVVVLKEGDTIEIYPDVKVTAFSTPGHCPSCLTYQLNNWVFTGDSYIPEAKVVTKLPNGDRIQAKQSIKKILLLAQGKTICPGHGEMQIEKHNNVINIQQN